MGAPRSVGPAAGHSLPPQESGPTGAGWRKRPELDGAAAESGAGERLANLCQGPDGHPGALTPPRGLPHHEDSCHTVATPHTQDGRGAGSGFPNMTCTDTLSGQRARLVRGHRCRENPSVKRTVAEMSAGPIGVCHECRDPGPTAEGAHSERVLKLRSSVLQMPSRAWNKGNMTSRRAPTERDGEHSGDLNHPTM
ncbi:hypothetical protein NDU88_007849 [Pleurodeles waltl]|uniref:Uncharacterized protein n=1 Tax=Pleurodeles waltl TaxID=8319 RepID=A0AAV7PMU3_PLEWA|nr:hypothetical protein NDU88_007849 [Pleurodeles waltl]